MVQDDISAAADETSRNVLTRYAVRRVLRSFFLRFYIFVAADRFFFLLRSRLARGCDRGARVARTKNQCRAFSLVTVTDHTGRRARIVSRHVIVNFTKSRIVVELVRVTAWPV